MKFPYSVNISPAIDTGEEIVLLRPEVPLRVHGPSGVAHVQALVDTGADNCIFPQSIASLLGIRTTRGMGPGATAFGGQQIELSFAEVELELDDDEHPPIRWTARLYFADFPEDEEKTVILGHEGFLDFFVATFDGKDCVLELAPTEDMPLIGGT